MGTSNLIILISCILLNLPFDTAQICSNPGNSSLNSTFVENSNRILSSLPSNVTTKKGFYPATLTEDFETVYMLALCRGDVSNDTCFVCVNYTSQAILMNCPNDKQTTNNGDYPSKCIVRFSNTSFFDVMEKQPPRFISITGVIRFSVNEFDKALHSLVESLIIRAAMSSSTIKFATRETRFAGYMNLYGLMRCVPGISSVDCRRCLRGAVDESRRFCFRERAVNVMRPNCSFQYDLTPSFESSAGAAPPQPVSFTPPRPSTNVTTKEDNKSHKFRAAIFVVVPTSILSVLFGSTFLRLRKRFKSSRTDVPSKGDGNIGLTTFNVVTIAEATNNFSRSNKIGEGGFGPVFKGQLSTGQLIAVKRNSEKSSQGLLEFTNEVTFIAKLQHRNLVRLLGCCIEGEERMLIYEYMPNGSLNSFIFENRSNPLAWSRRFDIIVGIARGLLYLHRDSRLRIVHRDLKASNVQLDNQMNPKIADFGLARAFSGDKQLEKTGKVVGTYGYMSPEYVMDGLFSMKSDVYSFGVLVLEIVSGKRNREFCHPDHGLTLLGHAWKLWIEGKALEVLHDQMDDIPTQETLKCIQVGLLCVQRHPEDRPTMSSVLLALDSETATLPQPKQPGFYTERSSIETESPSSGNQSPTTNEMTLTNQSGR